MNSVSPRSNPYKIISDFWGESLSSDLLQRIEDAPPEHVEEFESRIYDYGSDMAHMPDLPKGHLRPVLTFSTADVLQGRQKEALDGLALVLLLYAHEIVMDDVTWFLSDPDPKVRHRVGEWLLKTQPLYEQGIIHFRPVTSAKRHPSRFESIPKESVTDVRQAVLDNLHTASPIDAELLDLLADAFLQDVTAYFSFVQVWPGNVNQLLRTEAEYAILQALLNRSVPRLDLREVALRRLTQLTVPEFRVDIDSLVAIRRNDDLFGDWREGLAQSLSNVGPIEPGDDEAAITASSVIFSEMQDYNRRIKDQVEQSPALRSIKKGTAKFGVATLAAGAGFLAGGNITTALASAGASQVMDSAMRYLAMRKDRAQGRAVEDLVMSFGQNMIVTPRTTDVARISQMTLKGRLSDG